MASRECPAETRYNGPLENVSELLSKVAGENNGIYIL